MQPLYAQAGETCMHTDTTPHKLFFGLSHLNSCVCLCLSACFKTLVTPEARVASHHYHRSVEHSPPEIDRLRKAIRLFFLFFVFWNMTDVIGHLISCQKGKRWRKPPMFGLGPGRVVSSLWSLFVVAKVPINALWPPHQWQDKWCFSADRAKVMLDLSLILFFYSMPAFAQSYQTCKGGRGCLHGKSVYLERWHSWSERNPTSKIAIVYY